jgi:acetylornithine deacetylase
LNAIYIAENVIGYVRDLGEKLKRGELDTSFSPPHATVNIGTIKGGNAVNTVAEHCEMIWDVRRVLNSQGGNIKEDFSRFVAEQIAPKYPDAQVDISDFLFLSALEARPSSMAVEIARCCSSGHRHVTTASFGTEAGFFQSAGIDAVVCGPGSIKQAHKANEFVPINEMEECVEMLGALARPDVVNRLARPAGQMPSRA